MKKYLFLALAISCALFAQAQTITVSYNGTSYSNNDTLKVKATSDVLELYPTFRYDGDNEYIVARISNTKTNNSAIELTQVCTGLSCMVGMNSAPFRLYNGQDYSDCHFVFEMPASQDLGIFKMTIRDTANSNISASIFISVETPTAGIITANTKTTLSAYPNPVCDNVKINYTNAIEGNTLIIADMSGRIVHTVTINATEGTLNIDVSNLPKAIYMYGITGQTMKKMVVK